MNIEQLKIYLSALVDDYNIKAKALKKDSTFTLTIEKSFTRTKSELNGAVTAARIMGVKVKITYTEPTYYYSTLTLDLVQ